ncbi:hypothetical protein ASD15_04815 [Massilia sp. Root351]|jgi:hypothetical protein|uniref:hypothetical protein n=1 Tax=Massilia sp. Root351 TaxID=1736522 RepID=UPI00070F06CE|nr:hypothetical protein [Massilia sp. Root351]KQV91355.1 hypothetical protein ASD15_04815 [Massilia sp. Root351]
MPGAAKLPLSPRDRLLGALIYTFAFPLMDLFFVGQIVPAYGYELSVGGAMLRMLVMSLALLAGSIMLAVLVVKQVKRPMLLHAARTSAWALLAALLTVALLNLIGHGMICLPGACRGLGF